MADTCTMYYIRVRVTARGQNHDRVLRQRTPHSVLSHAPIRRRPLACGSIYRYGQTVASQSTNRFVPLYLQLCATDNWGFGEIPPTARNKKTINTPQAIPD